MLTFEVCLYHQVLPISLDGYRLNLGMVDPSDDEALSYIQTILAYLNYTLIPGKISSQAHKDTLSAYLKHREQSPQSNNAQAKADQARLPLDLAPLAAPQAPSLLGLPSGTLQQDLNSRETIFIEETVSSVDETVVIFNPPEYEDDLASFADSQRLSEPGIDSAEDSPEDRQLNFEPVHISPTYIVPPLYHSSPVFTQLVEVNSYQDGLMPLNLDIQPRYLDSPIKVLEALSSREILDEVLARVLSGGIGRLFFERNAAHGRVIWSQNGIIKAELENLSLQVFEELILNLKQLHNLPLMVVDQTVRVEVERFYDQERLLLRLQVLPGLYGEEANLQILRGVALQFYQQRQLASASRDALNVSQKLQQMLNAIYERAVANNIPEKAQVEMLSALSKVVNTMDEQLRELDTLNSET